MTSYGSSASPHMSPAAQNAQLGSSPSGGGIREFVRRISHSGGGRPVVNQNNATMTHEAAVDQLVDMGFPRALAARQLHLSGNDPKKAAEYLVHAAHPRQTGSEAFSHPDCPVCVREMENIRIAEGRRSSVSGLLDRVRSRNSDAGDLEPHDARRGSVGAMLRRPSISAALARMTTRDIEKR